MDQDSPAKFFVEFWVLLNLHKLHFIAQGYLVEHIRGEQIFRYYYARCGKMIPVSSSQLLKYFEHCHILIVDAVFLQPLLPSTFGLRDHKMVTLYALSSSWECK